MLKYWEKRGEDAFVTAQDGGFINNKCLALKPKDDVIVPKVGFRKKRMKGKKGNEMKLFFLQIVGGGWYFWDGYEPDYKKK